MKMGQKRDQTTHLTCRRIFEVTMLFLTNPEGMTSPVIPLINFSIMGSSSVVYWAGGGGKNVTHPSTHPQADILEFCYIPNSPRGRTPLLRP